MLIVGLGGTTRVDSSSERAVQITLAAAEARGAETLHLGAVDLDLPMYAPERPERDAKTLRLVDAIARADGLVVCSPAYHGGISGLIKNALDYVEDLRDAERPYLDGRAVGLLACASGWQATITTLVSLRSVVHALRGWPTPLGVAINVATPQFAPDGSVLSETLAEQLDIVAGQVVEFGRHTSGR